MEDNLDFEQLQQGGDAMNDPFAAMDAAGGAGGAILAVGVVFYLIMMAAMLVMIASFWILYVKAGRAGWKSIIPIYSTIVRLDIAGKPKSWILWVVVAPIVAVILAMSVTVIAQAGGGGGGGVAIAGGISFILFLLSFVFFIRLQRAFNRVFGKPGIGSLLFSIFFPYIFYPMLAFSGKTTFSGNKEG